MGMINVTKEPGGEEQMIVEKAQRMFVSAADCEKTWGEVLSYIDHARDRYPGNLSLALLHGWVNLRFGRDYPMKMCILDAEKIELARLRRMFQSPDISTGC